MQHGRTLSQQPGLTAALKACTLHSRTDILRAHHDPHEQSETQKTEHYSQRVALDLIWAVFNPHHWHVATCMHGDKRCCSLLY